MTSKKTSKIWIWKVDSCSAVVKYKKSNEKLGLTLGTAETEPGQKGNDSERAV